LHAAATGTRERPTSVGGFVVGGELLVPYTCPSRLATLHAAHVTPFSPRSVVVTHTRQLVLQHIWRTRLDAPNLMMNRHARRMNLPRTHRPDTHGHTHGPSTNTHGRTSAHETPPQRRRCVYLLTCRGGSRGGSWARGRAGGRAAGLWESPLRWPATGSDVRRSKVRSCPVHSCTLDIVMLTRVIYRRALFVSTLLKKSRLFFGFCRIIILWYFGILPQFVENLINPPLRVRIILYCYIVITEPNT